MVSSSTFTLPAEAHTDPFLTYAETQSYSPSCIPSMRLPLPWNCPLPLCRMAVPQSKWLSSGQFKQTTPTRHLPNVFLLCGLLASQMSAGWKEAVALTSVVSVLFPHWEFCWPETNPSAWEPKCPLCRGEPIPGARERQSGRGTLLTWTQLGEAAVKAGKATFLTKTKTVGPVLTNVPMDARHACSESLEGGLKIYYKTYWYFRAQLI